MSLSAIVSNLVMAGAGMVLVLGARGWAGDVEHQVLRVVVWLNVSIGGWLLLSLSAIGVLSSR